MELLWFLHAPFWQKMYFAGIIAGMSIFMYFIFQMLEGWNTKLKNAVRIIKNELASEKEKRKRFFSMLIVFSFLSVCLIIPEHGIAFDNIVAETVLRPTATLWTSGDIVSYVILRPTGDSSPLTMTPTPSGAHWSTVAEMTAGSDGDTSYTEGIADNDEDRYTVADISDYGSGTNYNVQIWAIHCDEGATSNLQIGIVIGGVNYIGWQGDGTSGVYTNNSYWWPINPATSTEWTYTQINALEIFHKVTDANPDTRTSQMALYISIVTPVWKTYPDDGILWDKLLSNDGDTSYIRSPEGTAWPSAWFDFETFSGTGYPNESYIVTLWTISKVNTFFPPSFAPSYPKITDKSSWYATSMIGKEHPYSANLAWENITITAYKCPWTNLNWTIATINAIQGQLATGSIGEQYFTELGLLIETTIPSSPSEEPADYNLIFAFALLCGCVIFVLFLVLMSRPK